MTLTRSRSRFLGLMVEEICRAEARNVPTPSLREGYTILLERVENFWDELRKHTSAERSEPILRELVHIATTAWRISLNFSEAPTTMEQETGKNGPDVSQVGQSQSAMINDSSKNKNGNMGQSEQKSGIGSVDSVQLTLDLAAVALTQAAEYEQSRCYARFAALNKLEELGCMVLRAAERQRAQAWTGNREVTGTVKG